MLVVTDDLVGAPGVEIGQSGAARANLQQFGGQAAARFVAANPQQAAKMILRLPEIGASFR